MLEDSTEWQTEEEGYGVGIAGSPMGNTMVNSLKVGDVDDDGIPEIVAGGFSYREQKVDAQITIWNWSNQTFVLETDKTWQSQDITEVKSLSLNDVDGDGSLDIINSGFIGAYEGWGDETVPPEQAQLRVWSWDGENLEFKIGKDWDIGEGVTAWNVGTGDVDNDGTTEIITIGCMYISSLCDPDLRIWSIAEEQDNPPEKESPPEQESPSEQESSTYQENFPFNNLLLVALIIAVAALLIVASLVLKNRTNRKPSETFS
jgi:hypothetical protein